MSRRSRQAAHTLTTYAIQFLLTGITSVLITRALGPDGRGAYTVLVTVATTAVSVGHLSIEPSHVSLWARTRDRGAIATNSLLLGPVLGVPSAVCAASMVVALGSGLVPVPSHALLTVALAAIPFYITNQYLNSVLTLRARIETVNRGVLLGTFVYCGGLTLLAAAGRLSLTWVVALWTVHMAVPLAVLIPATRPRLRDGDIALARHALSMGLRYHTGLVSRYLLTRVDILILNAFTTHAAVGMYSLAVTLVEMTRVLADTVAQVVLQQQIEEDPDSATALTVAAGRLATLLSLGAVGLMCAVAPFVIPMVYGSGFSGSVPALLSLSPGLLALGATRPINAFLLRLERPLLTSAIYLIALLANVGLNVALIPAYGIIGCALSSSIAYCALAGMQATWFLRATGTPPVRLLPRRDEIRYLRCAVSQLARSDAR